MAEQLAVPPNVVPDHLPPCTPERQPAEPLWPLAREALATQAFATLAARTDPRDRRCRWRAGDVATVEAAVGFHWAVALG